MRGFVAPHFASIPRLMNIIRPASTRCVSTMTTTPLQSTHENSPPKSPIPRNVLLLGWVSLFNDAASEMLYPIMPLFLTATLGTSPACWD